MAATSAFTSAGSKLYTSSTLPSTYDSAGYGALTWTEVKEITDLGEYGATYALVTHNPVGNRVTVKRKGSINYGTLELKMASVVSDAGQTKLVQGSAVDSSYAFKVVLQDGTINYFTAQIMSYKKSVGTVDQITSASVSLEIDSTVVEVLS